MKATTYKELHAKAMDLMEELFEVDPEADPVITILLSNLAHKLNAAAKTRP